MSALKEDVLLEALEIQNNLLRAGFDYPKQHGIGEVEATDDELADLADGFSACGYVPTAPLTWGFHSPLMYWNCSKNAVASDKNLLRTINEQSHRKSYMNLTLRPTSVFAGKSFVKNNITAADALVVTLFDLAGSEVGLEWDRRLQLLSKEQPAQRQWYIPNGPSHLYEFEFKQMSWNDGAVLLFCYSVMASYVMMSLRKTKAVKSTLGLAVTIIIELTVSIVASFTICGMLKVDLTRIPREVYPFVVFAIGLENMFRLMNQLIATPATMPTVQRVAHSLGTVGHLSLAVAMQNLILLWLLSKLVTPSVTAFCAFAAIALVVDFFLHLTFFVAVLSVDVQRLELQDSLDRISLVSRRTKSPQRPDRQTWTKALREGRLPITTRVAGTAVCVCFVLALNWHFFDNMSLLQMLRSLRFSKQRQQNNIFSSVTLPPINQRRTPASWLRMQDHHTAEEVISFVKPKAPSFVARIHRPVAVVLNGSDREGVPEGSDSLFALLHDLVDEHLIPLSLSVVIIVALTTILMNYLLWNELSEIDDIDDEAEEPELLHIGRFNRTHEHDILKIIPSWRNCITISSDRLVAVHIFDMRQFAYITHLVRTDSLPQPLWPIISAALNDSGELLALLAKDGRIGILNVSQRRLRSVSDTPLQDSSTVLFDFIPHETDDAHLVMLSTDGWLTELGINKQVSLSTTRVLEETTAFACISSGSKQPLRIIACTKMGRVYVLSRDSPGWTSRDLSKLSDGPPHCLDGSSVKAAFRLPSLGLLVLANKSLVCLFEPSSFALVGELNILPHIKKGSLRVMHSVRRECQFCRSPAVHSLALVFTDAETEDCAMRTFSVDEGPSSLICFSTPSARTPKCNVLSDVSSRIQVVHNPGSWEVTGTQAAIGIRKPATSKDSDTDVEADTAMSTASDVNRNASSQRQRTGRARTRRQSRSTARSRGLRNARSSSTLGEDTEASALEDWELWMLSIGDELHTQPLPSDITSCQPPGFGHREHEQLYAASPGPVKKLGKRSVAIALANVVLTVTVGGSEGRFDDTRTDDFVASASAAGYRSIRRGAGRRHND